VAPVNLGCNGCVRRRWIGLILGAAAVGFGPVVPAAALAAPSSGPVAYADGLRVQLASLETMPATDAATCTDDGVCRPGSAPGTRLIRVNVALSLPVGAAPLRLDVVAGTASGIQLLAGGDPAAIDCGNLAETTVLCTDISASVPVLLQAGGSVTLCESFDVPVSSLDRLTVMIQPPISDVAGKNPLASVKLAAPPP